MYPLLSIIIPVHNGAGFLPGLLQNIEQQHYTPLEIIIVDDGSNDDTARIACEHDIRYFYQDHKGVSAARNYGLSQANGEFILFFDVDDVMPEGKLCRQVDYLLAHPDVDIVSGSLEVVLLPTADQYNTFTKAEVGPIMQVGTSILRRHVFDITGSFDETMQMGEDIDFYFRAIERDIRIVLLRDVTLLYRQHEHNATRLAGATERTMSILHSVRKSMKRRRLSDGTIPPLRDWTSFVEPSPDVR